MKNGNTLDDLVHDQFHSIFEHAGVGMALTGFDDLFIRVNRKYAEMLGYSVEEMRGLGPDKITQLQHQAARQERKRVLLSGASREETCEKQLIRKDGDTIWVTVVSSRFATRRAVCDVSCR